KSFEITPGRQTNFVMDFDLRKSVQRTSSNPNDLNFASSGSLRNFIRLVKKDETGIIKGKMNNYNPDSDGKIIVYAYKKGTFDQAVETDLQAQVQFSNAITSTTTDAIGEYELHFLEAGDYEVIFASYKDEDQNGQLELSGKASVSPLAALDLSTISVAANSTATVNVDLSGVFPF
ncbi:MAG: carboxypeptidase-like regulatory domain-containing protein, partial [Bacteroidota bacterium]